MPRKAAIKNENPLSESNEKAIKNQKPLSESNVKAYAFEQQILGAITLEENRNNVEELDKYETTRIVREFVRTPDDEENLNIMASYYNDELRALTDAGVQSQSFLAKNVTTVENWDVVPNCFHTVIQSIEGAFDKSQLERMKNALYYAINSIDHKIKHVLPMTSRENKLKRLIIETNDSVKRAKIKAFPEMPSEPDEFPNFAEGGAAAAADVIPNVDLIE